MGVKETAEEIVSIMNFCQDAYLARFNKLPNDTVLCLLTDRTHRQIISDDIAEQKGQRTPAGPKQTPAAGECNICGRKLTEKEQKWILDHNSEHICYHCKQKQN